MNWCSGRWMNTISSLQHQMWAALTPHFTQVLGPHFIVHTSSCMPLPFASSAIQCSPSAVCLTSHDGCSQFWELGPVGLDDESFQRHFDWRQQGVVFMLYKCNAIVCYTMMCCKQHTVESVPYTCCAARHCTYGLVHVGVLLTCMYQCLWNLVVSSTSTRTM